MNIEKENVTFKQIESFIRNVNEKEWDNPIEKIKKFKKYYQAFPKINYCTHSQTIHKESCVSFKITSKGMKQHCKECEYEPKLIPTSAILRKKLFPNETINFNNKKKSMRKNYTLHPMSMCKKNKKMYTKNIEAFLKDLKKF